MPLLTVLKGPEFFVFCKSEPENTRVRDLGPLWVGCTQVNKRFSYTHALACTCSTVWQFSMIFVFFTASPYVHFVDRLCLLVAAGFCRPLQLVYTGRPLSIHLTLRYGWHSIGHKGVFLHSARSTKQYQP